MAKKNISIIENGHVIVWLDNASECITMAHEINNVDVISLYICQKGKGNNTTMVQNIIMASQQN